MAEELSRRTVLHRLDRGRHLVSRGAETRVGWALTVLVTALMTALAYLAFLGWDRTKTLGPDGSLHGPYEPWQVVGLCLALAAVAGLAGLRLAPISGTLVGTVSLVTCFSVDAATSVYNDGLWPIGASLVAMAGLLGFFAAAGIASGFALDPGPADGRSTVGNRDGA